MSASLNKTFLSLPYFPGLRKSLLQSVVLDDTADQSAGGAGSGRLAGVHGIPRGHPALTALLLVPLLPVRIRLLFI